MAKSKVPVGFLTKRVFSSDEGAAILRRPDTLFVPVFGVVVPIPALPFESTKNADVLPIRKLMDPSNWLDPFLAMLLIAYAWLALLNPWNCASMPFWS